MQDRKRELEEFIKKYLSGRMTDLERKHLVKWMRQLDLKDDAMLDIEGANQRMKEQIDSRLLVNHRDTNIRGKQWQIWAQIAAAVVLCLSFGWYLLDAGHNEHLQKGSYPIVETTSDKPTRMTCVVSKDSTLILEDGTRVHLLANSKISWMQPFSAHQRAIELKGKAFFEVAHDKARPFTVLTGNILTTALGTSFWVIQDRKNAKPRICLVTGRVSIKTFKEDGKATLLAILTPGQTWKETATRIRQIHSTNKEKLAKPLLADTLMFHHKPLAEVLPALALFYHQPILFSSTDVAGMSFYGTYTAEHDLAEILAGICVANDLELRFNSTKGTYTIIKKSQ